jgi:hypothetical protein
MVWSWPTILTVTWNGLRNTTENLCCDSLCPSSDLNQYLLSTSRALLLHQPSLSSVLVYLTFVCVPNTLIMHMHTTLNTMRYLLVFTMTS